MNRKRKLLPVRKGEWSLFAMMFTLVCLVHLNFWILRNVRNTLVVADRGGAAELVPYFELWATLPATVLMAWALARLLRSFSLEKVFYMTTTAFLAFFVFYGLVLYPYSQTLPVPNLSQWGPGIVADDWIAAIFYSSCELWKVGLLSVLFWGFANRHLPLEQAKRFYAPLLLGASAGALIAGPITISCTTYASSWQQSMHLLLGIVVLVGLCTLGVFRRLSQLINKNIVSKRPTSSLAESVRTVARTPYLGWLLAIVCLDYLAYTLAEVVFLSVLKEYWPDPIAYCNYLGQLTLWSGVLTGISAFWIAPQLLEHFRWRIAALALPVIFLCTTSLFFFVVCFRNEPWMQLFGISPLALAVAVGSVKHCLCRAAKFTLFDATRELAYVPLSKEIQMQGKLVIDGMGSRVARAASSILNMGLVASTGSFIAAAPVAGGLALSFTFLWIGAVQAFDKLFEKKAIEPPEPTPASTSVPLETVIP